MLWAEYLTRGLNVDWISVKYARPNDGTFVLVFEPGEVVYTAWYYCEDGGFFRDDNGMLWTPTHWMPLPDPPND